MASEFFFFKNSTDRSRFTLGQNYSMIEKHVLFDDFAGVGWSTGSRLRTMGRETCGDLQGVSLSALQKEFGPKTGQALYSYCRGIDDRPIKVERERKSVSAEINYGIRFTQV